MILDRTYYDSKLHDLISCQDKFQTCAPSQTEETKRKINEIAKSCKETNPQLHKAISRIGTFGDGHLYGLPKIHKDRNSPPLRPIINMSGTVTHEVAQYLNKIIRPYCNQKYMLRSSDELLVQLSELKLRPEQCLVSLDVESLFMNVPITSTINIILNAVYEHPTIPPPNIQKQVLEQLLHICTSETPFKHNGQVYKQINGVSMGSPLGPTFGDFYMSYVENYLLSQSKI